MGLAESQQAIRRFDDALGTFTALLELLTQCKQPDEVDEELLGSSFLVWKTNPECNRIAKTDENVSRIDESVPALSQKCDDLGPKNRCFHTDNQSNQSSRTKLYFLGDKSSSDSGEVRHEG